MRNLLILLAAGAALAGCKESPSTEESAAKTGEIRLTNATTEEVLKQMNAASAKNSAEPGEWETTHRISAVEMPDAPEAVKKQIETDLKSPPLTAKECRTAESIKPLDLSSLGPQAANCKFEKYVIAGGKVDAVMLCKNGDETERLEMTGTQSKTAYDLTLVQIKPGKNGDNKMSIHTTGKRIGECKA